MHLEKFKKQHDNINLSIILIKPDGYESEEVRSCIYHLIQKSELKELLKYPATLQRDDVLDIWPKLGTEKYPISREFSFLYMTSGISEVIVVSGDSVENKCSHIKKEVRNRFGTGMFCNCIHTPIGEIETLSTVNKFLYHLPENKPFLRHLDQGETLGIWGQLAKERPELLRKAAEAVWKRKESGGWEAIKRNAESGKYNLYLLPGDPHSIDYGMSILYETMPQWPIEHIYCAYLEAEAFGRAILSSGERQTMQNLEKKIYDQGLFVELLESED
jgi:hypothetical protein